MGVCGGRAQPTQLPPWPPGWPLTSRGLAPALPRPNLQTPLPPLPLQAEKFRSKAQKADQWRSGQQYCRYLYYLGRIRTIQLEYAEAKDCLQQVRRRGGRWGGVPGALECFGGLRRRFGTSKGLLATFLIRTMIRKGRGEVEPVPKEAMPSAALPRLAPPHPPRIAFASTWPAMRVSGSSLGMVEATAL